MSLILEALKRSEQERALGQPPGLLSTTRPPAAAADRRRRRMRTTIVAAVAAAALLIAAAVWLQREAAPPAIDVPAPSSTAAAPTVAMDTLDRSALTPEPAPHPAPHTLADEHAPSPIRPEAAQLPSSLQRSDPAFDSVERESRPVAPEAPAPAPARRTEASSPVEDAAPQAAPAQIAPVLPPAPHVEIEPADLLPRLADLSPAQRAALPPLKVTMHVYSESEDARFVLVDGRRLGQGASLQPGLRVSEIRRDGTVFEHDGLRFVVPRP